jgi:hypothetical protein
MSYNLMGTNIKKSSPYYFFLVLVAIFFPLTTYPRIYGVDAFQYIWMANALKDGALFSNNTWLISPLSYFGYYPFSPTPIGVPIFLAFLINLLNFISCGIFSLTEAILFFNIILIVIIYKSSRNLGNKLFEEEWSRFIFVAAILFSPNIISNITMTVSTRIIITIVMMSLLNLNLKTISNYINNLNILKIILLMVIFLLVGALAHRLWIITIITIVFMIFTLIIQKSKKLSRFIIFFTIPLSIIAFFIGLDFFFVDPGKINSPFFDNSTLIGVSTNLSIHYALEVGLILIFFPVGVIITLYKVVILLNKPNNQKNPQQIHKSLISFYLLIFMVPLLFMAPSFYATAIFLPIIIIFSVEGLIYAKKIISSFSKKLDCVYPMVFLLFAIGYSFLYIQLILRINLWYAFLLFSVILFIYLFSFILQKYNGKLKSKVSFINFNNYKFRQSLEILVLIFSIVIFSTTTVVGQWRNIDSNLYPWENRYLTEEEQDIINFFQDENLSGLIYTNILEIAEKISGVGFLPVFSDISFMGNTLYYSFILPNEVYEHTVFSLYSISTLGFLTFNGPDPIRARRNLIIRLNVTLEGDLNILRYHYNVQYIITDNFFFSNTGWILIESLPTAFSPVFSTQNLLIWKLY